MEFLLNFSQRGRHCIRLDPGCIDPEKKDPRF